ncbi:undecaprenyl-diphosphatase [Muriicola jejuensis]|uniref:Phosphatase PAP2 family protein n=1 Tax=Muriicola jejuensis TaxID=504488 RepID=A0A6P0U9U2_9FLAO|nr:phosphatase PAP2 family protein [Muriicola jejuensis]NER09280.1 phosphatase PAP2 family protein [Muriicola jejuensis]SMP09798.1 undecaprenyl-diphosphatase [Muriicola jejuensis]
MWDRLIDWDRNTFIFLNSLGIEEYDGFWSYVTHTSSWLPLFALFFVLFLVAFSRKEAFARILTTLLLFGCVMALMYLTKEFVARLRPNNSEELRGIIRVLFRPEDYSFFSGHAANSFAITTLVVLFLRKKLPWVWVFYIWPLLFSLSRIYVGVHYPLDLIAGSFVGIVMALLFYRGFTGLIAPYLGSGHPGSAT